VSAATTTRFRVTEGSCLDCAGDVASALRHLPGVLDVQILATAGLVIVHHDDRVDPERVDEQASRVGLRLVPAETRVESDRGRWWRQPRLVALAAAALAWAVGLAADLSGTEALAAGLYTVAIAVGGVYPARSAWMALRSGRLTIATLLVVATIGAIGLGVLEEAALLVVVFSLGEVLEDYAADKARGSIRALMALVPPTAARREPDGTTVQVPVEALVPGEVVMVRPGERVPTDGVVIAGRSAVDQSPVTGESIPVEVGPGSAAFGGTLNGAGVLEVRVDREYADTTLARIIRQVEEAQAHQGQAQRFADRFGAVYTPAMFLLALVVAAVGLTAAGDPREWFYRALVVLTVSCSCALVISVPVSVVAAISRAARDGVLIKGGVHLETLGRVRVVAFDKTGTLTWGRPQLTDAIAMDRTAEHQLVALAAAVEAGSEHPLAAAILAAADTRGNQPAPAADTQAIPGVGVHATVAERRLFVGRPDGRVDLDETTARRIEELEKHGKTVVVLADHDRPLGVLAIADQLRPAVADTVHRLHELGVTRTVMLTGDNDRTATAVAAAAGIDDYRARLLPEDKTTAVHELKGHGAVAMVGDGINDAPALATADVGVAMGTAGTDIALETADVALMADDLAKLPQAIHLAHRALRNIRQNIALSLLTIATLVLAALSGSLTLTTGLLLNEGTALLIIANALRLLRPSGGEPA
jgi:Cd2+/Zn2+-exporting ATPase